MTIDKLSFAQAASLIAGKDLWHTQAIPSHNIPSLRLSDGPKGLPDVQWQQDGLLPLRLFPGRIVGCRSLARAPTVNIHRSPLGGRNFEAFSEDPLLSGYLASNLISGMQEQGVGATVKHFVCNDVETDRTKVGVIVQERALREIYLKPFEIVVRNAKPWAVMASYNKVNGLHVSESKHLLDNILRKEWGFDGVIMSDWWGSYSTSESLNATLDIEMPGAPIWRGANRITRAVGCGKVSEETVRANAKRVLDLVNRAIESGTAENAPQKEADSAAHRDLNRRAAASSVVLLKNEKSILPLRLDNRPKIAVIGPNAIKNLSSGGGSASVNAYHYVSALDGIKAGVANNASVSFAHGCYSDEMLPLMKTVTMSGAEGLDIKLFPHPFDFDTQPLPPAAATVTSETSRMFFFDCLPPVALPITWALCEGICAPEVSGEYDFGVVTTGRAKLFVEDQVVVDNWSEQQASRAFFEMGTPEVKGRISMTAGRQYKVAIQYSCISALPDRQPGHMGGEILRIGARLAVEQADLRAEALQLASTADVVILCLGTDSERETEGFDRTTMSLPEEQDELADAVLDETDRVVVVNFSGSPVAMPWASKATTIIQAWFLGSELGNGLADVLLGNRFERTHSDVHVSRKQHRIHRHELWRLAKGCGGAALYLSLVVDGGPPREARSSELSLLPEHLAYWDDISHSWIIESGRYRLLLGHSSVSMAIETEIMVEERMDWRGSSLDILSEIRPTN
ncbi:glycoside hydrolase superfamily [Aspergillus pseudodeflectus]|uniref:beta-glucosidase n=1 Tax=Aspergillus pseudodeflectus TaxID=176178 RepID=A0ABR4JI66_9EURO